MQPDTLHVVARTRSGWEAIDLGLAMARVWWREVWGAWFLLVIPCCAILVVSLRGSPWWTIFLLWWLRPLFGRVVLHVLGTALFNEAPSPAETLRALPRWLVGGLWRSLTLKRLSPSRTYTLPVSQLEGLRGQACRERERVLALSDLGTAAMMHSIVAHVCGAVILAVAAFSLLFIPEHLVEEWLFAIQSWFQGDAKTGEYLLASLYVLGMTVAEPLLVAGGFGLYVNRRIWLEGWDIEMAFRGLSKRFSSQRTAVLAVALFALLLPFSTTSVRAEALSCKPAIPETASACANEILSHEDFGHWEEVESWVRKESSSNTLFDWDWDGGDEIGAIFARLAEVFLWIALFTVLLTVILRVARDPPDLQKSKRPLAPTQLFGLDLKADSLPDDVAAEARRLFHAGETTGALSLLYRAALIGFIDGREWTVPASATEGDCMQLVHQSKDQGLIVDFGALNDAWILSRYAHRSIAAEHFEDLCNRWSHRFNEEATS